MLRLSSFKNFLDGGRGFRVPRPFAAFGEEWDREGRIASVQFLSGNPFFLNAAKSAVQQWRYRPYFLNGQTVEVETQITVNFKPRPVKSFPKVCG